jgi:hypothetical protein
MMNHLRLSVHARVFSRAVSHTMIYSLIVFLASCSPKQPEAVEQFKNQPQISAPKKFWDCAVMVNNYVKSTRSWDETLFNVAFDGFDEDSDFDDQAPMFRVSHIDSWKLDATIMGAGPSFFVVADCTKLQVIRELGMQ